ncbi:hypothetical protein ASPWEDRAFT_44185 [Aspergillus wentii DTO 134E9]|uniref:Extracellular mutant protein 11 C-terminal domain-containing protein n=1 Tax=Aspergillus wentii DTO 134E9 TaxID=1073089 RepID=A0A1L9RB82_ASPWE|nr:uncharacterized protein ASPWEDRAFT_44185 [Aspergillus wentii DTO 134E9]KAI9934707.1 hypothetical protein MW887_000324 [Aspergillus wentii]OJJ32133.1 hypothetical protein ASPWEDRAFT_44185 [Aspergillus wentii DTO 134E9]
MGVGDYIHSKEAGQLRSATADALNKQRRTLAEQARVEVPATKLVAPVPLGLNGRAPMDQYGTVAFSDMPHAPHENSMQKNMFDTDVEGVDDSTIAGTSVMDVEEIQHQIPRPVSSIKHPNVEVQDFQQSQAPQNPIDTRPVYQFRNTRRPYESNWYENLGDKAAKTAGFESDDADADADDDESQLTSLGGGEDERAEAASDWYFSHKHRPTEEPLSRRLESFWSASKRKSINPGRVESKPPAGPSVPDTRRPASMLPVSGGRKITLPRSMTATPRTRFSPPKPSLLEQLDISPTHRTTGPRALPNKKTGTTSFPPPDYGDDANIFSSDNERRDSILTAFDMTNIDALDDDETIRDPFSKRRSSVRRITSDPPESKKRHFEPDYPPEILYQKSFKDLQAEPFDHVPAAPTKPPPNPSQEIDPEDKVSHLLELSDEDRRSYLSNLSMDEWEDCGDQLIDRFSNLLTQMKDLRHARRKTAAVFEAEIRRRHETVEEQASDISTKLDAMRTGGAEVLRGRTP